MSRVQGKCSSCDEGSHCCIFHEGEFAFVGISDARRIRKITGLLYKEFLDYSPLRKKIISGLEHDDPSLEGHFRYRQLDKSGSILRMKSSENGRCFFLDDMNRCRIYDIRPKICRIYPFWAMKLVNGRIKVITHDPEPDCMITKGIRRQSEIENLLSGDELAQLKRVFSAIKEEDLYYRKNIRRFMRDEFSS